MTHSIESRGGKGRGQNPYVRSPRANSNASYRPQPYVRVPRPVPRSDSGLAFSMSSSLPLHFCSPDNSSPSPNRLTCWTSRREGQGLSCCHAPPNGGAICRECRPPTMCEQVLHSPARWGSKTAGAPRTQDTCVAAQTTASQHSKTGGGQARSSNSSQPSLGMCSHRPLSSSPSPWAGRPHHRSYQYILSGYMYG